MVAALHGSPAQPLTGTLVGVAYAGIEVTKGDVLACIAISLW